MTRPDPTPPDASLFPIAPTYTADLDAKALDLIVARIKAARAVEAHADTLDTDDGNGIASCELGALIDDLAVALRSTGREV